MTGLTIFGIAIALAMDAFAVSIATGMRLRCLPLAGTLRMAAVFGGFQFAMPVIGWLLGSHAQRYIEAYDHWIAFALLVFVGGRMLKESWENRGQPLDSGACSDPTRGSALWVLGIATSLDALAVGLSFALLGVGIWWPATVIGLVCFTLTLVGMVVGSLVCRLPGLSSIGNKANALGGLVLIGIGVKILIEHGVFS